MALGTPGTTPNSTINTNAFAKCAPAISTNIRQCGTVTQVNATPMTVADLSTTYQKSNDFRVMEALFHHDMEIKMCEATQNGLYDFFMAQKVNVQGRINTKRLNRGLIEIAPFILARQFSPINNEYWVVTNGTNDSAVPSDGGANAGEACDWSFRAASSTNIPADVNYFPAGQRVYIEGKSAAGSAVRSAFKVVGARLAADGTYVTIYLAGQNSASNLLNYYSDKLASLTTGLLRRGSPNVNDFEKFCQEAPTVLNWKNVPFWVETTRTTMCKSSLYDKWRKLVLEDNALYREFWDLDEIQRNKQLANDWQRRMVNNMFWGKPLPHQTLSDYDSLDTIPAYDGSAYGLGVDGAALVARRANAVGIYEQLAECDRVADLQGLKLNLPALFVEFYNIMRVRESNGRANPKSIDIFTDSTTAELINQAMILYYKEKSGSQLQYTVDAQGPMKKAEFGFNYRSYVLFWPPGVTMNVITHYYFDDWRAAGVGLDADDNTTRVLWVLDFSGIYPGILSSNRVVHKTGDLKTLASVNPDFACVMAVPTKEQTLLSMTWTMIVECPASNLILENFSDDVPEYATLSGQYPPGTSTTSATTFTEH